MTKKLEKKIAQREKFVRAKKMCFLRKKIVFDVERMKSKIENMYDYEHC